MPKILGLDLGNAKLKLVHLEYVSDWSQAHTEWKSVPLPVTEDRQSDFAKGLPLHIQLFALVHGLSLTDWDAVVICSSHAYSYTTGDASVVHLIEILKGLFPDTAVFLARADGALTTLEDAGKLSTPALYDYVLTNFLGSAYLGSKLIQNGISIDIGTTTTDLIPIVHSALDPVGLSAKESYLDYRYAHHRIQWYGLTKTPLHMLLSEVELKGNRYQVVPRNYCSDLIFSLLEQTDPELLKAHAYGNLFPTPEQARMRLSQFVGLDQALLTQEDLARIHQELYQALQERVMEAIRTVAQQQFGCEPAELEFAVFALGETLLAQPVLKKLGVPETHIKYLEVDRDSALWSASSAFSMALLGLEHVLGQKVDLPYV